MLTEVAKQRVDEGPELTCASLLRSCPYHSSGADANFNAQDCSHTQRPARRCRVPSSVTSDVEATVARTRIMQCESVALSTRYLRARPVRMD